MGHFMSMDTSRSLRRPPPPDPMGRPSRAKIPKIRGQKGDSIADEYENCPHCDESFLLLDLLEHAPTCESRTDPFPGNQGACPNSSNPPIASQTEELGFEDLSSPFDVHCPYSKDCKKMEARDFPSHVKSNHTTASHHDFKCPICALQMIDSTEEPGSLLQHLVQYHDDLKPCSETTLAESGLPDTSEPLGTAKVDFVLKTSLPAH